ncbi:hypothetical protein GW17_00011480 [Ensete ventricosum]|nr:hypothetical protein GW17_00011480 [Ensete ventricosum]
MPASLAHRRRPWVAGTFSLTRQERSRRLQQAWAAKASLWFRCWDQRQDLLQKFGSLSDYQFVWLMHIGRRPCI